MKIVASILGVVTLFSGYFWMVIRYRARKERQRERKQGLDPLRR